MADWETWTLMAGQAAGAVAVLVAGGRVWSAFRLVGEASLRRLALGLFLLAASQVAVLVLSLSVVAAGDSLDRGRFDHFDLLFYLYYATLLSGLGGVFWSFGRHPFRWAPAYAPILLIAGPVLQLLTILALFFVVLHAGLNHIARKGTGSSLVAIGFFFVFAAHILHLYAYTPLGPRWWPGELLGLVGYAILIRAVPRLRSVTNA